MAEFLIGTVSEYDLKRGFGFIRPEKSFKNIFVHHSDIQMPGFRKLEENDRVKFQIGTGPDGRTKAVNVEKL